MASPFASILALLRRLFPSTPGGGRTAGRPTSANSASSFHLWWDIPNLATPIVEVSVILEVVQQPVVARLYFWALQVTFAGGPGGEGAHLGLQHHPNFPGRTAANWGGYAARSDGGGLLRGSESPLPSTPGDPNTRDFPWRSQRRYRLRVRRSPEPAPQGYHAWRGEIEDVATGEAATVRDLYTRGDRLASPVMWTEAFAWCDDPSAAVRWTDMRIVTSDGEIHRPPRLRVNYQSVADGGCSNTNVESVAGGVVQRTNTERIVQTGATIQL